MWDALYTALTLAADELRSLASSGAVDSPRQWQAVLEAAERVRAVLGLAPPGGRLARRRTPAGDQRPGRGVARSAVGGHRRGRRRRGRGRSGGGPRHPDAGRASADRRAGAGGARKWGWGSGWRRGGRRRWSCLDHEWRPRRARGGAAGRGRRRSPGVGVGRRRRGGAGGGAQHRAGDGVGELGARATRATPGGADGGGSRRRRGLGRRRSRRERGHSRGRWWGGAHPVASRVGGHLAVRRRAAGAARCAGRPGRGVRAGDGLRVFVRRATQAVRHRLSGRGRRRSTRRTTTCWRRKRVSPASSRSPRTTCRSSTGSISGAR